MPQTTTTAAPYTIAAAAAELGLCVQTVYKLVDDGVLQQAPVMGKIMLLTSSSVERYKRKEVTP